MGKTFVLEVWGDFACFTRPEFKVERFSYPVMTPSAARGIMDAIYSKYNEFTWRIHKIEILNPINYIALRRNEVKEKISVMNVKKYMDGSEEVSPIVVDATEYFKEDGKKDGNKGRVQRQTMALKDVRYRIYASIKPWEEHEKRIAALESQAERRIKNGKCFYQPYFGCREFAAYFEECNEELHKTKPIDMTVDLGLILYDVFDLEKLGDPNDEVNYKNNLNISLFHAFVKNGMLEVPDYESNDVIKNSGK